MEPVTELRLVLYAFDRVKPGQFQLKRIFPNPVGIEREELSPVREFCKIAAVGVLAASGNTGVNVDEIFSDPDSFLAVDRNGKALDLSLTPEQAGLRMGGTIHVILNEHHFPRKVAMPLLIKEAKEFLDGESKKIFIGHGHSPIWRELKDFLEDRLKLECDEFDRKPVAGMTVKERLESMLDGARFAFLILTAETQRGDDTWHAREAKRTGIIH